jgi:alpha/beta superfamily hydrolase
MYPAGNLFIPAPHGQLEAILKPPRGAIRGPALVLHPHPLFGGTMQNKVVFRALPPRSTMPAWSYCACPEMS